MLCCLSGTDYYHDYYRRQFIEGGLLDERESSAMQTTEVRKVYSKSKAQTKVGGSLNEEPK